MANNIKQRNKTSVSIKPAQRVKEFGPDKFYAEDGLLWCKICNVPVDHVRRQTITDHLGTKKHTARENTRKRDASIESSTSKRQSTINGCIERSTAASSAQEDLVMELVEAFMAANIPLEKVDNPSMRNFMEKNLKGGGGIPKASTLRELYVTRVFKKQQANIISKLAGQKVVIIADETTDIVGRYAVNVLIQPLNAFKPDESSAMLVNTDFLTEVNNVSIAQLIIHTLTEVNVHFNDVVAFVTDNAAYMKKCFRDNLRGLLPNAVHVTCWAHILSLVGEEFREALRLCDMLAASIKAIFSKAPGRRARYLHHLRQMKAEKAVMPPTPVITRWNSWFEAVLYHAEYLEHYVSFVASEIAHSGATIQLNKLSALLQNTDRLNELRAELEFVTVHCQPIMKTLTSFEAKSFMAVDVYNKVSDLLSYLKSSVFPLATSNCENAKQNAAAKLELYFHGTRQPAIDLFKSVRIFDPRQLPLLSKTFADHAQSVPTMMAATDEWQTYLDIASREIIPDDITAFWRALEERLPRLAALAKVYIALPISSVDVERSFSKYGSVLSPLRQSLTQENLRAYSAVFFNNK